MIEFQAKQGIREFGASNRFDAWMYPSLEIGKVIPAIGQKLKWFAD